MDTAARMCTRCGAIAWFGDTPKLAALRVQTPQDDAGDTAAGSKPEE